MIPNLVTASMVETSLWKVSQAIQVDRLWLRERGWVD
jgi:hypothetical protein